MSSLKSNPYGCEESDRILEEYDKQTGRSGIVRIPIVTEFKEIVTDKKEILNTLLKELYCRKNRILRPNNKDTWTMKDGKTILIKDMSNSHLANCIKMLERSL